jgi:UDP:flavonoid glycosyltransferase YjiC (YdhE family)
MKFALACWGSRGDVEPCVAVGRELLRRGHDVCIAVPDYMVGFAQATGLPAVAWGVNLLPYVLAQSEYLNCLVGSPWRIQELIRLRGEIKELYVKSREEMTRTLTPLADGADLLITMHNFENVAANVAEYHDIPLASLHLFLLRPNDQFLPFLPAPLGNLGMRAYWWLSWRMSKKVDDAQRRQLLGLPETTAPWSRRIAERGSLEIQAYDEVLFPGLTAEWAKFDGHRPLVGTLTLGLPGDADEEVASWIAAGTPPIFFSFGSLPVESPADTLAMIDSVCAQLGERALVCADGTDFSNVTHGEHVKVAGTMNHGAIFPTCRAVVHRGSVGITAAGLRAGVPTLILWKLSQQLVWGAQVKRLKTGTARRWSATTEKSLIADLRTILAPQYAARAREIATRMTSPAESVAAAADLVENFARLRRVG